MSKEIKELVKNWCAAKYYHLYDNDNKEMVLYIKRLYEIINKIKYVDVNNKSKIVLLNTFLEKHNLNNVETIINLTHKLFEHISDTYYSLILANYFTKEIKNLINVLANNITLKDFINETFIRVPNNVYIVRGGVRPK